MTCGGVFQPCCVLTVRLRQVTELLWARDLPGGECEPGWPPLDLGLHQLTEDASWCPDTLHGETRTVGWLRLGKGNSDKLNRMRVQGA